MKKVTVVILKNAKLSDNKLEVGLCRDPKENQAVQRQSLEWSLWHTIESQVVRRQQLGLDGRIIKPCDSNAQLGAGRSLL